MSIHSGSQSGTAPRFAYLPPVISAATFVRRLRGHSQPVLIEDTDRNLYVLKMSTTPQNGGCLANELIGTSLCHALGFSAPRSCFIEVSEQFIDHYLDAWVQPSRRHIKPVAGLHYGTAFVGTAEGAGRPFDMLPRMSRYVLENREQLCGMYLFDIWANHLDHRQSVYLATPEKKSFSAIFIDNGMLFGGPQWRFADSEPQAAFRRKDAAELHWQHDAVQGLFERFNAVIPDALAQILNIVPSQWCAGELAILESVLLRRLEAIEAIVEPFTAALA